MKFSLQLTFSCTPGISQRPSRIAHTARPTLLKPPRTPWKNARGRKGFLFPQACEKIVLFLSACMREVLPRILAALSDARKGGV